jgi:hypothetical protein
VRLGSRFRRNCTSGLQGLLPPRFLALEDRQASFPQTLIVFRGSSLSGGDISAGFLHGSLGLAAPLGQHFCQRFVDKQVVESVDQHHQNDGGYGSEQ